jgi:hypothetical protein
MSLFRTRYDTKSTDNPDPLRNAFNVAVAFVSGRAGSLALSPTQVQGYAQEEASFGRITVDDRGLTAGSKLHVVQPARALLAAWREARSGFDTAIEPRMSDILAVESLQAEIETLKERRAADVAQLEQTWEANQEHLAIRKRWEEADALFNQARRNNGMRDARMTAYQPLYWIGMLCIGIAEWLINYDTFLLFVRVPAIAAGATLILGVLLAFSAHGHGELFKQWSHRFGQHQSRMNRVGGYRLLGLSTLGLLIVVTAAGGSRYAAVLHTLAAQSAPNLLPDEIVPVSPLRDVLISLLANLGAWVVGVFIAYFCHDTDPDFMDATRQHRKASRKYYRARHEVDDQIKTVEAKFSKEMEQMERAANARSAGVAAERGMLEQIAKHENGIVDAITSAVHANAELYRDALVQVALAKRGEVSIIRVVDGDEKPATPYEYKAMNLLINADLIRGLVA